MTVKEFLNRKKLLFFNNENLITQLDCFQNSTVLFLKNKTSNTIIHEVTDNYYSYKNTVIINNWSVKNDRLIIEFAEYD